MQNHKLLMTHSRSIVVDFGKDDLLSILKGNDSYLMNDERVLGGDAQGLAEETFSQLGVVGKSVLQPDVQHRQVTPVKKKQATNEVLSIKYRHGTIKKQDYLHTLS